MNQRSYFLGSNTSKGFYSYFGNILKPQQDGVLYIIKGGPGSGKSTLMKKFLERFLADNDRVEKFYCSSDPASLDGVLSVNKKVAIIDGTNPHSLEPKTPGAFEIIINTGEGFNTKKLKENFYKIEALNEKINAHHKRAQNIIKSANIIREQTFKKAEKHLNYDVVYTMAEMLPFWRFLKTMGDNNIRLLSAVSVDKTVFFDETLKDCKVVYGIADPFGAAAHYLIKKIAKEAENRGLDFTLCPCGSNPDRLEHIIFADGVAFTTLNYAHRYFGENMQTLDGFYLPMSTEELKAIEAEINQASALIKMATKEIAKSKELHDELEKIYVSAMDFSVIDKLYKKIIEKM